MATTKKKPASPRSASAPQKKKTYRKKGAPRYSKEQLLLRQSLYILMIFVALFLLLSLFWNVTGLFGRFCKGVLTGLLGYAAYMLPPVLLLHAVLGIATKPCNKQMHLRAWVLYGMTVVVAAMAHMIVCPALPQGSLLPAFYKGGQAFTTGGVIGGFLCRGLTPLLGTIGTGLVLALLFVLSFMVLSGLTAERVFRFFFPEPDEAAEQAEQSEAEPKPEEKTIAELMESRKAMRAKAKHPFKIDQPLGDAPSEAPVAAAPPFHLPNFTREQTAPPQEIFVDDLDLGFGQPAPEEAAAPEPPVPITMPVKINAPEEIPWSAPREPKKFPDRFGQPPDPADAIEPLPGEELPEEVIPEEYAWEHPVQEEIYHYPPIDLLHKGNEIADADLPERLRENAQKIVDTLKSFGVDAKVINVSPGPAVTRYELSPSAGVKISRITNLADDIALNLAAAGVRIEAPIPGKAAVGLEVPNAKTSMVYVRDIIDSEEFKNAKSDVAVALGMDIGGQVIIADISKMPHLLIAGATGSGKSVCINTILASILYKAPPNKVRLLMIDPKVVELGVYNGIPHLLVPVVTDPKKAAGSLNWAVTEMLNRYKLFADKNVRDMRGYNQICEMEGELAPLPHIVIVIDELADLMMVAPNEVEDAICRLAQMARAAGMHLVIATQRPSVDVITGTIKANIPSRIAFAVSSQVDSRTILDMSGAEKLLGKGDMLYYPVGAAKPVRVQGCFISDQEVESVTTFVKEGLTPDYDNKVMAEIERHAESTKSAKGGGNTDGDGSDEMLPAAIEVVLDAGMASVSLLQRKLKLGYARAARIVDEMEERGIVGPFEGAKPRQVTITRSQWQEMCMRSGDPEQPL